MEIEIEVLSELTPQDSSSFTTANTRLVYYEFKRPHQIINILIVRYKQLNSLRYILFLKRQKA